MKTSNAWSKKPRTMLRSIRHGDILCIQLDELRYAFGQILCKILTGHVAVIFDATSLSPDAASVHERPATDADALRYPILTPRRDPFIRSLVTQALENRP